MILLIIFFSLVIAQSLSVTYDVYLQLMQLQINVRFAPYRVYEMRWEVECTTDQRQPITKFPTAFSIDETHLIFFDSFQSPRKYKQEIQNFVYVREAPEMAVICFRLFYRNDLELEDCMVVDVRTSDFADVRYSTTTRGHGNALTYQAQVTPSNGLYSILMKRDDNETLFTNSTTNTSYSVGCIAAISVASIESFLILLAALGGLCFYFLKSGLLEFGILTKRRSPSLGAIQTKTPVAMPTIGKANRKNPQPSSLSIATGPTSPKSEQHYRAPSASSADSGLSTISASSSPKSTPVVIYDDPPEPSGTADAKKKAPAHYLSEVWRRNKPGAAPAPPLPDYRIESGDASKNSSTYDVYAVLEDPNNWDPPEQQSAEETQDDTDFENDPAYSTCKGPYHN